MVQTTIVTHQKANAADDYHGCCADAMVDVEEGTAVAILILNIIFPQFGTLIASCLDKRGCNCSTFLLCFLQGLTTYTIFIGYIWGIVWAINVLHVSKLNYGHHHSGYHGMPAVHVDVGHHGHHGGHHGHH